MAHKSLPASAVPASGRADFWLNRATRATHGREESRRRASAGPLRVSIRRQVAFAATLNYGPTYSVSHRVRDISPTGAYVEMDAPDLVVGTAVEFVLHCRYPDGPGQLRIAANVARVDGDGVALHFGTYDDDTYTNLVKLLYAV